MAVSFRCLTGLLNCSIYLQRCQRVNKAFPWSSRGVLPVRMDVLLSRITIDPEICHGKPVIRGLRYPVESILEYLAAGESFEDVLRELSDLERADLLACLEFAKRRFRASDPIL